MKEYKQRQDSSEKKHNKNIDVDINLTGKILCRILCR